MPAAYVGAGPNLTVGISGMQERVRDVGGTFGVESAPGDGCVVRAALPICVYRKHNDDGVSH